MSQLNLSQYYICLATGENSLLNELTKLRDQMTKKNQFHLEVTGLHCGDIFIGKSDPEYVENDYITNNFMGNPLKDKKIKPLLLIERKTIKDFCGSFKSDHYKNQKSRMMSFRDKTTTRCVLVVEGYYEQKIESISPKIDGVLTSTLEQCFTSIRLRDNFFVKHVENTYFHADFLTKCLSTIERYKIYDGIYENENLQKSIQRDFADSLKVRKKNNMTPELCYKVQLTSIPGISMNFAENIAKHYKTLPELLEVLKINGKTALIEINVGKNKLGKVKSQRIYEYLLQQ